MVKSYLQKDAVEFKQTPGKTYVLNPAFDRHLTSTAGKLVLDVGCGDGYYINMCKSKGLNYTGIDISSDMISSAKLKYPEGNFLVGSCTDLSKIFAESSFDIVISSMLFPEFATKNEFDHVLKEVYFVLKPGGTFLLGSSHPAFDMYMRKYLLNSTNVETDFYSYYDSGKVFKVKSNSMDITFEDHHWTIEDYVNSLIKTGFRLVMIDECKIVEEAKVEIDDYDRRIALPSYILFNAIKD